MKLLMLTILLCLLFFGENISAQIRLDSAGAHLGRFLFENITFKLAERNAFELDNKILAKENINLGEQSKYQDRQINLLKQELIRAINKECDEPFYFDKFFWGFVGAVILAGIGIGIGIAL